jgi:hypothetical protein
MKNFLHSRDAASKGAALMIVLAFVVLLTGLALAYFSRASTDRQLAHSSYNDTSADLLARSALDVIVGDFKQEILAHPTVSPSPGPPRYITPAPYPAPTPPDIPNLIRYSSRNAAASRASNTSSAAVSANGRSITTSRWNSHYLVPRGNPSSAPTDSSPVQSFTSPDWVLVTGQGPALGPTPTVSPSAVIGRYAFAVYDEGGLLDMNVAGSLIWHADDQSHGWKNLTGPCSIPSPTPWLVNVGRKGIVAFADLAALPDPLNLWSQAQVDNIVGWRNYMTAQLGDTNSGTFGGFNFGGQSDCSNLFNQTKQDFYGSYLLYFGDPPFTIESLFDKLAASAYPFTSTANYVNTKRRTDQSLTTRQELLKLRSSLGFSPNVLQYMGTFSRERNWPAPDWPNLSGRLSDGRFNMNNLALVVPNPGACHTAHGRKKGWQTGKNRNKTCGTPQEIIDLFGLFYIPAATLSANKQTPGYWYYVPHTGPNPAGSPDPNYNSIICWDPNANRNQGRQADFFQTLHYALSVGRFRPTRCNDTGNKPRTFAIGASLIDQYDSGSIISPGGNCYDSSTNPPRIQQFGDPSFQLGGCDLDAGVQDIHYATHTTVIGYGQGTPQSHFAFGAEKDYDPATGDGDLPYDVNDNTLPHRPCGGRGGDCISNLGGQETPAPTPLPSPGGTPATVVINHAFSNVGEFGYGVETSAAGLPTLDFSPPGFLDAPVLDFFSYNPISSAYPRAGIVNLYTRNAPVLAAILAGTLKTDAAASLNPPSPVVSGTPAASSEAMALATRIVTETQKVLAGNPDYGPVTQTDMTRAIAARLAAAAAQHAPGTGNLTEQEETVSRALAEVGQTRTWNLLIDVIAQTGKYKPSSQDLSGTNFVVEGEKRYWLHISLGRDLVKVDPILGMIPCQPGDNGCQVDVLGTQLEEVIE